MLLRRAERLAIIVLGAIRRRTVFLLPLSFRSVTSLAPCLRIAALISAPDPHQMRGGAFGLADALRRRWQKSFSSAAGTSIKDQRHHPNNRSPHAPERQRLRLRAAICYSLCG